MSVHRDISRLFETWLTLTKAESEAIRRADWEEVKVIQARKKQMQEEITLAHETLSRTDPQFETPFRAHLGRLVSMENKNASLIEQQSRQNTQDLANLEQNHKNLQRIRNSYLRSHSRSDWQCLS